MRNHFRFMCVPYACLQLIGVNIYIRYLGEVYHTTFAAVRNRIGLAVNIVLTYHPNGDHAWDGYTMRLFKVANSILILNYIN